MNNFKLKITMNLDKLRREESQGEFQRESQEGSDLYVSNLPLSITEEEFRSSNKLFHFFLFRNHIETIFFKNKKIEFEIFGKILRIKILRQRREGPTGNGLIEFERHEDYLKALNLKVNQFATFFFTNFSLQFFLFFFEKKFVFFFFFKKKEIQIGDQIVKLSPKTKKERGKNEDSNTHNSLSSLELSQSLSNQSSALPIPIKCYPIIEKELEKMYLLIYC